MKFLRYLSYLVTFLAAILVGTWFWAPWEECGFYALEFARLQAARKGYYVTYDSLDWLGPMKLAWRVADMDIEGPMTKVTFSEATLSAFPFSSLLSGSARARLEFGKTQVRYIPNNSFDLERGEMNLAVRRGVFAVKDAHIEGDVSVSGDIVLDLENRAVAESTAVIRVPVLINAAFGTPMLSRFVEPLPTGEWRIKENAVQNQQD